MRQIVYRLSSVGVLLFLAMAACSFPAFSSREKAGEFITQTARAENSKSALTSTVLTSDLTPSPSPTITQSGPSTPTPIAERAEFISDVTIPDGTIMAPGQTFLKTWRLKNTGTLAWTTAYYLVYFGGEKMGATEAPLPQEVLPGRTVDLSIQLIAPKIPGRYRSYWKLRDPNGNLFGISTLADTAFYVDIEVRQPTPTPTLPPFAVSDAVVLVSPPQYQGACPVLITIVGSIDVTAPGVVQYQWNGSESGMGSLQTVTAQSPGQVQVQTTWVTSQSGDFQLVIISPNYLTSNQARYTVTCQ